MDVMEQKQMQDHTRVVLAGRILDRYKATGECIWFVMRTDTCGVVGFRLGSGWYDGDHYCGYWDDVDRSDDDNVATFALQG